MTVEHLAAALGALAVVGQLVNVILALRVENAVLRSQAELRQWAEATFVPRELWRASARQ